MYRVVVIDDEMIIRVGFASFIDWESEGFEVVGEAADGEEGLQLCRTAQPHVIFTDIGMARMDGLTFIEKVLQEFPRSKVVILSCMDDFSVIQQALRLGVQDYFLKISFNAAQLLQFVRKMKKELDAENQAQPDSKTGSVEVSAFLALQNSYRRSLETGIPLDEIPEASHLSQDVLTNSRMALFLISKDDEKYSDTSEPARSRPPFIAILEEMFSKICKCDIVEINASNILVVGDDFFETRRDKILRYMREVQDTLFRMLHCSVSIGLNSAVHNLSGVPKAYMSLLKLQDERFYQGDKTLMIDDSPDRLYLTGDKEGGWGRLSDQVSDALEIWRFDMAAKLINDQFSQIESTANQSRRTVLDGILLSLAQYERLYQRFPSEDEKTVQSIQSGISSCLTLSVLRHKVSEYIRSVQEQVEGEMRRKDVNQDILKAKQYVREHLEDCSAKSLAEVLCYNYSYFCNLFKRETGINFQDYLLQERMRYASKLHKTTGLAMDEIAWRVGYTDISHFKKLLSAYEKQTLTREDH